jgi:hypothetical protein
MDAGSLTGGMVETIVTDAVTNVVEQALPERALKVINAFEDVARFIQNVEIHSQLTVKEPNAATGAVEGTEVWKEMVLIWRGNCAANAPEGDICSRYPFNFAQAGFANSVLTDSYPITVDLAASPKPKMFLASQADPRFLKIEYGRFFVVFIDKIIVPMITGGVATNVGGLLNWMLDCATMATGMDAWDDCHNNGKWCLFGCDTSTQQCSSNVGIANATLQQICTTALNGIGQLLEGYLVSAGNVEMSNFYATGEAQMEDGNHNRTIEKLQNGVWTGSLGRPGATDSPVNGTFTGERAE